jgi:hypothetical protein
MEALIRRDPRNSLAWESPMERGWGQKHFRGSVPAKDPLGTQKCH